MNKEITEKFIADISTAKNINAALSITEENLDTIPRNKFLFTSPPEISDSIVMAFFKYHSEEMFSYETFIKKTHNNAVDLKHFKTYNEPKLLGLLYKLSYLGDNTGKIGFKVILSLYNKFTKKDTINYSTLNIEDIFFYLYNNTASIKKNEETDILNFLAKYISKYPYIASVNFLHTIAALNKRDDSKDIYPKAMTIFFEEILNAFIKFFENNNHVVSNNQHYRLHANLINGYTDLLDSIICKKIINVEKYQEKINKLMEKTLVLVSKNTEISYHRQAIKKLTCMGVTILSNLPHFPQKNKDMVDFLDKTFSFFNKKNIAIKEYSIYQKIMLNQESSEEFNL